MNSYEAKQAARRQRLQDRADALQKQADATSTQARKMAEAIPFGQPILVGHHSEKRDRAYRGRINQKHEKARALHEQADEARAKAATAGTGGISSDDPDAVVKLREKLAKYETLQATMRDTNKAIRANKTKPEQIAAIVALGLPEKAAATLIEPDFAGRIGFADYQLSNNSAEIRRIKARIAELDRAAERQDYESKHTGFSYREDTEENRVMFAFDKKPSQQVRQLLRGAAFKFSPSRDGAWVRQLNNASSRIGRDLRAEIEKLLTSGDTNTPN